MGGHWYTRPVGGITFSDQPAASSSCYASFCSFFYHSSSGNRALYFSPTIRLERERHHCWDGLQPGKHWSHSRWFACSARASSSRLRACLAWRNCPRRFVYRGHWFDTSPAAAHFVYHWLYLRGHLYAHFFNVTTATNYARPSSRACHSGILDIEYRARTHWCVVDNTSCRPYWSFANAPPYGHIHSFSCYCRIIYGSQYTIP